MDVTPAREREPAGPVRVALYAGVAFRGDAVSKSFILKLELLTRLAELGYPVEVVGFTQASDYDHPSIVVAQTVLELMRHPFFQSADVHVFEYAMSYDIFNALFLVDRPVLIVDHNTTPPDLVDTPAVKAACERTCQERANLALATRLVTDGEFTRDELLAQGMDPERVSVLHLPAANPFVGRENHEFKCDRPAAPVELLFVGRLVRAKGVHDLLAAVESLWDSGVGGFRLTLAGSMLFSDLDTVAAIEHARLRFADDEKFTLVLDGDDRAIAHLFGRSDALVMPSYHEGYCVPVVEAMTSGCYVISSDAGNLPNVVGGLGSVVPTGDVAQLARAIATFVGRVEHARRQDTTVVLPTADGDRPLGEWRRAVARHLTEYSAQHYDAQFLGLLGEVLAQGPTPLPPGAAALVADPIRLRQPTA